MQRFDHLIITLIKKVNHAFVLEKEGNVEGACDEFRNVQHILNQFGNRHKGLFKPLQWCYVFMEKELWLKAFPLADSAEKAMEAARFFAVGVTNDYFKRGWMEVCKKIVDPALTHCLKKELICFKDIYDFFLECGVYFNKRLDQGQHLKHCMNLEEHPEGVRKKLLAAIHLMEGGPGCERSKGRPEQKKEEKEGEGVDKCHPPLFIDADAFEQMFCQ